MRKILAGTVLGFGVLLATATSASAADLHYSGYHYPTVRACEDGYWNLIPHGPGDPNWDGPHECRWNPVGVYELWWSR
ncbi:hypothetical protein [Amycolatopsis minnesotensis]|uniref:Secreted protein n=1 Tax=Amycolatopsis minnesotensis TaxID=337894 RepID=A0ABP5E2A1_9PSEU